MGRGIGVKGKVRKTSRGGKEMHGERNRSEGKVRKNSRDGKGYAWGKE